MIIPTTLDTVFVGLTHASPLADILAAAEAGARRAPLADIRQRGVTIALDEEARDLLETWLAAYRADEEVLLGLDGGPVPPDGDWPLRRVQGSPRAAVLDAAWRGYSTTVLQARAEVRS